MKPYRITRSELASLAGRDDLVLAQDVRDGAGMLAAAKGSYLTNETLPRIAAADWNELHAIAIESGEVHEFEAGGRVARAAAGRHVDVGSMTGGHWPLNSSIRGVVEVDVSALREIDTLDGIALYTLFDAQVVEQRETVARAKIIPFALNRDVLERAEHCARSRQGIVHVRPFLPRRIGAVIQETLGERAMARATSVLAEKVAWFGSELLPPRSVTSQSDALGAALREHLSHGANVLLVAGSRPMDPLDPVYEALAQLGARIERLGIPAHPGSLLWLGYLPANNGEPEISVVGLPSCGLFSQASVFDLVLPRLLSGERLTSQSLAGLGHGGLLTRDMQFRFPPYRTGVRRGEVLDE